MLKQGHHNHEIYTLVSVNCTLSVTYSQNCYNSCRTSRCFILLLQQESSQLKLYRMSKRPGDPEAVGTGRKKPCKVQATLFNYFDQPQEAATSSKAVKGKLDFSPQHYGIHVYTQEEIKGAVGLKQEFRKFWNDKAVEICKDESVCDKLHNKNAIEGAIYSSWRLQSTHLLRIQAEEIIQEAKLHIADEVSRARFLSSISKNMERMLEAHVSTNDMYEMMAATNDDGAKKKMETELHEQISRLKTAQNALKKSIHDKQQQLSIEKDIAEQENNLLISSSPTRLSDSEIENVIQSVKNEA